VPSKNKGLGKGFAALMPTSFDTTILLDEGEKVFTLDIAAVQPNNDQPRQHFDQEALDQLAVSIKNHGVLQPIVVTPAKNDTYTIIAGERRWRASQLAGLTHIPALIRSIEELEQLEIALVENVQRVDLSPLEQARSIERLHQQFNVTYEQIAERLGKAASTINNTVRLLQLPAPAFEALEKKDISEGHARAILALKQYPDSQEQLLKNIVSNGWSVRQAERFVSSVKNGVQEKTAAQARVDTETPETKRLKKQLGVPVHIKRTARGGRLEITFSSDEELARVVAALER
jgi:ParB family transcriptional regulator, chromosome partitioning protein